MTATPSTASRRPAGDTVQRAAPTPAVRPFRDTDACLIRCATLLADSDEWHQTGQRIRVYRNGQHHFAVCECSATGRPHSAITRLIPTATGVPGCSVIVGLADGQIDDLLESLR